MNTAIDKRNFFLTMSAVEGQRFAHYAGFSIPSEEVQKSEIVDVVTKWLLLNGSGVLHMMDECLNWTLEIVNAEEELSEDELESTRGVITSYSVAMLCRLIDQKVVHINPDYLNSSYDLDIPSSIRALFNLDIEE